MEDELQKRNTDCVYFLASPLTCKKGSECEYRHSENARFNPRDCWYWLSGNCINPACSFRHPPLDGRPETSSESVHLTQHSSVAAIKTNVPCYFFFNAYCIKGDKCPFLHGPNHLSSDWKSTKTASAGIDTYPVENKTSIESDTRPVSVEAPPNPSQRRTSGEVKTQFQPKDVRLEVPNNVNEHSPSPQISLSNCEKAALKLSDTLPPVVDFIDCSRIPVVSEDQSSEEEETNNCADPEERWESSPGFDVLVDGRSEHLGYEEDTEYMGVHDSETGRLHNPLIQYNYEDTVGYDHMDYPGSGILYEHGMYDLYDHLDNDYPSDDVQRVTDHVRGRMLEPMMFRDRLLPRELEIKNRNVVDLRDHLKQCKRDYCHGFHGSRKRHSTSVNENSRDQRVRRGMSHRRLASEVGMNMIRSRREFESGSRGSGRMRRIHSRHSRRKQQERRRQARLPSLSSEISRGPTVMDMKPMQESTAFTGPKTLAQIKEEKRRANPSQLTDRNSEHDHVHSFSQLERGNGQLDEGAKTGYHGTNRRKFHEVDNDSMYDEDYDDDDLEKKLAGILD